MSALIKFTPEQLQSMRAMYVNGLSSYHIADRFGICKKAVLERLRNMGVEIRTRGRPMTVDSEVREKALAMREQGAGWKEISAESGISQGYLFKVARDARKRGGHQYV